MKQYRKKPVVIEAVQFDGTRSSANAIDLWMVTGEYRDPPVQTGRALESMEITTLEGVMRADPGDWIIKGVAGEFYPCKPDIFEQVYELAVEA